MNEVISNEDFVQKNCLKSKENSKKELFNKKLDNFIDETKNQQEQQKTFNNEVKSLLASIKNQIECINRNFQILFDKSESLNQD
jgi:hypothetical protein